ncbi:MAG: hypothetical protein HY698_19315 [Deltaproteobacteria bacterium]|nr:hypothetical protein [Deltaproteobacteria bacterium]
MEDATTRKKRVVCPVSAKDGKTYWLRMGNAYVNKDNSINVYLDCLPVNGRLQVRDWDDPPWEKRENGDSPKVARLHAVERQEDMPF